MQKIDTTKYKKVLFVTAHPDDLEGFAGGLAFLLNKNAKIYELIFSVGNNGRWEDKYLKMSERSFEHVRLTEAKEAAEILGVVSVTSFHFHDRQIPSNHHSVEMLTKKIKEIGPDAILSFEYKRFHNFDPHPDHVAVGKLVKKAIHASNEKVDYFVFTTTSPNRVVDISKVHKKKMQALKCHRSQKNLNKIIFPILEYVPCRALGLINRSWYVEGYRQVYN
jgi:LmbE family N-acetylglucosaminyl deacetylase